MASIAALAMVPGAAAVRPPAIPATIGGPADLALARSFRAQIEATYVLPHRAAVICQKRSAPGTR